MMSKKRIGLAFCSAVLVALLLASVSYADFSMTGRWLLDGGGTAKRGDLKVSLSDSGYLDVLGSTSGDIEIITGYKIHVVLDASLLGIKAWSYDDTVTFPTPIPVPKLDPTVNDPFVLPAVTVDRMTYQVTINSTNSGIVDINGVIDVDYVGDVDITSESVIWKEGTPKPAYDDKSSGCDAGAGTLGAVVLAIAGFAALRRKN